MCVCILFTLLTGVPRKSYEKKQLKYIFRETNKAKRTSWEVQKILQVIHEMAVFMFVAKYQSQNV